MGDTTIRWTMKTWNPISGCRQLSPGCDNCYAKTLAENRRGTPAFPVGFDPVLKANHLHDPEHWKAPAMIFVNSMSDLFLGDWPATYIFEVLDIMFFKAPQHVYQVLTKRPKRMLPLLLAYLTARGLTSIPDHIWFGVTIESDAFAWRADYLRKLPAPVTMISAEPLLGPLPSLNLERIGWLIAGGESGGHLSLRAHPENAGRWMKDEWAADLRDRCVAAGVPFFFKQHSGVRTEMGQELEGERWEQWPAHHADVSAKQQGVLI